MQEIGYAEPNFELVGSMKNIRKVTDKNQYLNNFQTKFNPIIG